ncbi:MAG TPA: hypothetical protein VEA38_09395 [Terriglobales bacterium]|nr:hypothetical protein [Terriglobales bacterium]
MAGEGEEVEDLGGDVLVRCQRDACRVRYATTYIAWRLRQCVCPTCHGWEAQLIEAA